MFALRHGVWVIFGVWALGCGDGGEAGPTPNARVTITAEALEPGGEWERCYFVKLDNDAPIFVDRIHATAAGMHHLVVQAVSKSFPDGSEPCFSAPDQMIGDAEAQTRALFSMPTGARDTDLRLPAGRVIRLEPRQQLMIDLHVINPRPEPLAPTITVDFWGAEALAPGDIEVGYLILNNTDVSIPPGPSGQVVMECPFDFELELLTMSTHMHTLGASSEVTIVGGARDGLVIHTSGAWDAGGATLFDPPLVVEPGEVLRVTCVYDAHDDAEPRTFGAGFANEMCQVEGYVGGAGFVLGGVVPFLGITDCLVIRLDETNQDPYRQIVQAFSPAGGP